MKRYILAVLFALAIAPMGWAQSVSGLIIPSSGVVGTEAHQQINNEGEWDYCIRGLSLSSAEPNIAIFVYKGENTLVTGYNCKTIANGFTHSVLTASASTCITGSTVFIHSYRANSTAKAALISATGLLSVAGFSHDATYHYPISGSLVVEGTVAVDTSGLVSAATHEYWMQQIRDVNRSIGANALTAGITTWISVDQIDESERCVPVGEPYGFDITYNRKVLGINGNCTESHILDYTATGIIKRKILLPAGTDVSTYAAAQGHTIESN